MKSGMTVPPAEVSRNRINTEPPVGATALLPLAVCVYVATPADVPLPMSCVANPPRSRAPVRTDVLMREALVMLLRPDADKACDETVYALELTAQQVMPQSFATKPGSTSYVNETLVPAALSAACVPPTTLHTPVALRNVAVRAQITLIVPPLRETLNVPDSDPSASRPNA